jgi:serine/threonine protein phosphatase PrpC
MPEALDPDGYCSVCGVRSRPEAEMLAIETGSAAGVSHPGLRRRENQDALFLRQVPIGIAAVVCDGISSCAEPARAARTAAIAAGGVLAERVGEPAADLTAAMLDAIAAAQTLVSALPYPLGADPPSCTLVAAACRDRENVVASVGDSRAYWLGDDRAELLTVDDAEGHAVTRWVGSDAPEVPPRLVNAGALPRGRLVLCTDGLWNHAPDAVTLADLSGREPTAQAAARALLEHALAHGGRDNVTVAVIDVPPTRETGP